MKTLGIVAHSAEGAALCFLTACREGSVLLGEHMHPDIVVSAIPMGRSMAAWRSDDHATIAEALTEGVEQVVRAGADFFVCPDNTAHIVLEEIADDLPVPGLHIAHVVCREIEAGGWTRVGVLGTKWTMDGTVYPRALAQRGMSCLTPDDATGRAIDDAIFDELCNGVFRPETEALFLRSIDALKDEGAECVILGCTEIPLIVTPEKSSLPCLDSTRLLAKYGVREAVREEPLARASGWL